MKKTSSITDIANKLHISVTTVSFILNGKAEEKRISKALAEKVIKFAKAEGYVPNHLARSLRTGKTHILGLLVEDISNHFFATIAAQIEDAANAKGYRIFYCSSKNDTAKAKELLKVFEERKVDGYILTPVEGIQDRVQTLLDRNEKVVLFDRYFPEVETNYVVVDNESGAYEATKHLIDQGFRDIAFITIKSKQTQMEGRLQGYRRALAEGGLRSHIKKVDFDVDTSTIIREVKGYLASKKKIDAVFFATNYLGVSGLEAIKNLGLTIPGDIGVVSFDDHDLFRLHSPAVTAVAQPIDKIAKSLIRILLDSIADSKDVKQHVVIAPELIVRESSLKPVVSAISSI